jgi:hypothetical protein
LWRKNRRRRIRGAKFAAQCLQGSPLRKICETEFTLLSKEYIGRWPQLKSRDTRLTPTPNIDTPELH